MLRSNDNSGPRRNGILEDPWVYVLAVAILMFLCFSSGKAQTPIKISAGYCFLGDGTRMSIQINTGDRPTPDSVAITIRLDKSKLLRCAWKPSAPHSVVRFKALCLAKALPSAKLTVYSKDGILIYYFRETDPPFLRLYWTKDDELCY